MKTFALLGLKTSKVFKFFKLASYLFYAKV